MRLDYRGSILATAIAALAVALAFVAITAGVGAGTVALAGALGGLVAVIGSSAFAARHRARARAIADVGRRYALGDLSRPGPDYGDDELGIAARALDDAVQELGRRVDTLSRDRARMEAILGSMVEGVLVVDEHRQAAAGQRRRAPHAPRWRATPPDGLTSKRSATPASSSSSAGCWPASRPRPSSWPSRRDGARDLVARAGASGRDRPGRHPGAARHHRSEARRSDPARLRRQRLARAAHAAHRHQGLRRGPARRPRRRRGAAAFPRDHPAPCGRGWSGWSRTCCGWRGSTPGRSSSSACPATCRALLERCRRPTWSHVIDREADAGRRSRPTPRLASVALDPAKVHDIAPQPGRERRELHAGRRRSAHRRRPRPAAP